jgi:hypothetical protein
VPYDAALDLQPRDASTFDGDDEVDLVIHVVGHALAGDDPVVGLQRFEQHLVDLALSAIGKARFVRRDRHAAGPQ